jgi:hypothetical protein
MADGDRDVLSSLPRTRPERRSAKRDAPPKPKPRPKPVAKASVRRKPAPSRRAAPPRSKVPPAGYAVPKHDSPVGSGTGELVATAVQAFGELANLGGRALRDALGRLPKP